jgi:hypothetical protein
MSPLYMISRRYGAVTFLARTPILDQINADLIAGLSHAPDVLRPLRVFMGVHKGLGLWPLRGGFRLGIQTEQFYDEAGTPLWALEKSKVRRGVRRYGRLCHALLDLSESNRRFYEEHAPDLLPKLTFGPYIFPDTPPVFRSASQNSFAFFGATGGDRRPVILGSLPEGKVDVLSEALFYEPLLDWLASHRGVLNVHFDTGTYTEAPRLLSALRAGKVVLSDPLSDVLREGLHYLALDADPTPEEASAVFAACAEHLCGNYSFKSYLDTLATHQ